jgi:hypothetical protein
MFPNQQPSILEINSIDQESQEPPEETTMLLWDSNHLMPFNNAVEVLEILVVQM